MPMACPAPSDKQLAEANPLHRRHTRDPAARAAPLQPTKLPLRPIPAKRFAPSRQEARKLVYESHVLTAEALRHVLASTKALGNRLDSDDPMMESLGRVFEQTSAALDAGGGGGDLMGMRRAMGVGERRPSIPW